MESDGCKASPGLQQKKTLWELFEFLYGYQEVGESGVEIWASLSSSFYTAGRLFSFLVFNLLCAPCVAAMVLSEKKWETLNGLSLQSGTRRVSQHVCSLHLSTGHAVYRPWLQCSPLLLLHWYYASSTYCSNRITGKNRFFKKKWEQVL